MILQPSKDKLGTQHQNSRQSWRNSYKNKINICDKHRKGRSVRTNYLKIAKVENSGNYHKYVNEVNGLFKEIRFLFRLVSDGSQKFPS